MADAISGFVTTMQDMGSVISTDVHDAVMAAYRTFEAGGTNSNAFAVMQTALQSIDSVIMQGLVSGGDVTGLVALRSQMESGLSGNVRQSVFGSKTATTKAMADAVALLMKLPADVQGAIDTDALSQAYFDFLTSGGKGKSAAQAKAVEVLFASAEAAIATGKLDMAAVQELRGLMAEIDSERSVGDNNYGKNKTINYIKLSEELGNNLDVEGYNVIEIETSDQANTDWADMGFDKPPIALGTKVFNVEAGNKSYSRVFCEGYSYPKSRFILH